MINRAVRQNLLAQLGISKQALSQRVKRLKDVYGPMTTEEAVYVIAHMQGIDLSKELPLAVLDRVRALVPRQPPTPYAMFAPLFPKGKRKTKKPKSNLSYPLVKPSLIDVANNLGAEVYPQIFLLENSIRKLIDTQLSKLDKGWWDRLVPSTPKKDVERIMKIESRYPYRDRRGDHPLMYANFKQLKEIVLAQPDSFTDIIIDLDWFKVHMDEIYMARNGLAHSVPLSKDDISRIALFNRDWARLLAAAGFS